MEYSNQYKSLDVKKMYKKNDNLSFLLFHHNNFLEGLSKKSNNLILPASLPSPCCCMDTAKKIETEVGGAIMNGMSVRNAAMMLPMAQHTVVAIIDPVSSYPTLFI